MLLSLIDLTGKDLSLWRLLCRFKEPEYRNFNYFLHAADKSCPMLREGTVIPINNDHTPASYIRSIFGRFAYCYMLENSLRHWMSARLAQLVRSLPVDRDVKPLSSRLPTFYRGTF